MNILTGTWVLYIPHVKTSFELNDSEVGLALFSLAVGLLISFPFVPLINKKLGIGHSTKWGIFCYCFAFNLPLMAPSYISICASLFIIGMCAGLTDISMNALISHIEKENNKHIMSTAHGFYSLGGFIGAGIGSILIGLISTPAKHMFLISSIIFISNMLLSKQYQSIREKNIIKEKADKGLKKFAPLLGLAFIAFIIMINEGAIEHWSNLFLFDILSAPENIAGVGFIAFSLCMTIGRFFGDKISQSIGSIKIILFACLIAVLGFAFLLTTNMITTVIGFGIIGLGLSIVVPEVTRLAGNTKGVQASHGIAIVSGIGFSGFLIGPLMMGFISDWSNLKWSFGFLFLLVIMAAIITKFHISKNYK